MKCRCGMKDVVKPKQGQTEEQYISSKKCRNCNRKGEWKVLSDDEARWD